ncbi:uncharacterized protein LOC135401363 isoform X1 [Ornithodoros turicata]
MADSESISISTTPDGNERSDGISRLTATIFVLGAVAGVGVLALPHAIADSGWTGVAVVVWGALSAGYSGSKLGTCWTILEERWEEYKSQTRNPYPSIAYRAFGRPMRSFVSSFQVLGLFGYGTVFLLLAADLMQDIVGHLALKGLHFSMCYWLLILAVPMGILMWLGTPKDFWFAGFGALGATLLACIVVIVVCVIDILDPNFPRAEYETPTFYTFFRAFGIIMFSYGGTSQFPTIQNDMRRRSRFPMAVRDATTMLLILYTVMCGVGYGTFGSNVHVNILKAIGNESLRAAIQGLFILHLVCAFLILINPMCQEVEEHIGIPREFTWKRVAVRTCLMLAIVFVCQSVPHFDKVLSLVGAVYVGLTTFVFPPIFYIRLCSRTNPDWKDRSLPFWEKVLLWELVLVGVIAAIAGTVTSIQELVEPGSFSIPCYLNSTAYI